jgi:hypothetical protein
MTKHFTPVEVTGNGTIMDAKSHERYKEELCDHCYDHDLFTERQKILDNIPTLLTWMNINKGVFLLLAVVMTLLLTLVFNSRSEMKERQVEYEERGKVHEATIDQRVLFISRDVTQIRQDIAVIAKTMELHDRAEAKDRSGDKK